ncbi:hypothetical protein ACU8KH_04961 [Lachancea thermotolerans]
MCVIRESRASKLATACFWEYIVQEPSQLLKSGQLFTRPETTDTRGTVGTLKALVVLSARFCIFQYFLTPEKMVR